MSTASWPPPPQVSKSRMARFDCDDLCAYSSVRTVKIRDRRLGLTMFFLQLAVFIYVVVFQMVVKQSYMDKGVVSGTVRLQLKEPSSAYRWPDQSAPYCNGVTATTDNYTSYTFPAAGYYKHAGSIVAPQAECLYLDAYDAVTDPLEADAMFIPSRISMYQEVLLPQPACATDSHSFCNWQDTITNVSYISDVEMFTLNIDHSFSSSIGISRSAVQMDGALLDLNGDPMDPCIAYANSPAGCPSFVTIGVTGTLDIMPLKTLLLAGGLSTLDLPSSELYAPLNNETHRYAGVVVVLSIQYSNFMMGDGQVPGTGTLNNYYVKYFYSVAIIPDQQFKAVYAERAASQVPSTTRTVYDKHGIRVVVVQQGNVGAFDFQVMIVNLTAALGLLSVAALLTDIAMTKFCPLRFVYKQYKQRTTIDFSDLTDSVEGRSIVKRFKQEDYLVDPIPPVIQQAFAQGQQRMIQRKKAMELPQGATYDLQSSSGNTAIDTRRRASAAPYGFAATSPNKPAPTPVAVNPLSAAATYDSADQRPLLNSASLHDLRAASAAKKSDAPPYAVPPPQTARPLPGGGPPARPLPNSGRPSIVARPIALGAPPPTPTK